MICCSRKSKHHSNALRLSELTMYTQPSVRIGHSVLRRTRPVKKLLCSFVGQGSLPTPQSISPYSEKPPSFKFGAVRFITIGAGIVLGSVGIGRNSQCS